MMKRLVQRGIGLLELMLSLAIIAILLIMATRYYQTTKQSQEVNDGVQLVNSVVAAMTNYITDHPDYTTDADVAFSSFVSWGYLPLALGSTGSTASPWGTNVGAISMNSLGATFVTISDVPSGACQQLAGRLAASCQDTNASICGCGTATSGVSDYTGNFGTTAASSPSLPGT